MIYQTPRFLPGGDRFMEVELGDGMDFVLNFRVHSLASAIREEKIKGVIELVPELASMMVSYDPAQISYDDLSKEITRLHEAAGQGEIADLPSRLFSIPVLYFDPWTDECIEDYRAKVAAKTPDPDLICELNNVADRAALRRLHASSEYWVAALGFWPGLCSLMPLDDRARLVAPKYDPPRTWTPKGAIGLGGALTCIYPDQTPGGYQLLARTPVPTFDREQRLSAFKDSLALFRPGDRVRFQPIEREEYDWIEARVEDGSYQHSIIEYQMFSVDRYQSWRSDISRGQQSDISRGQEQVEMAQ
ncbi:5-oxoprolinase subunit B family protein [Pseudohoeflea coraliihabitans]|uniref:Allophanate hydrolase subunit 1 n=1 Tax=Pseudohoeflea coraliihabitans TaxID=2860393 RepID=A0ABS6WQI4_9HYPH|nr:allophanate hydrolase subunit 1 [Pseudohoeflea sp. DP4N28-3]MBW3098030.1 allophanate hydrolase subunit 1 [Pseudohoeflea sp. DP4N28-3]